ncbi:MAG: GerAB/ArcD/ProY family transporter, partial [Acetivibrionales bacterium]
MLSDDKKISIRQAIFLFVTASFTPTVRIVPAYAAQKAKQAAWLSPVVTAVLLILLVQLWQVIYRKYRDKSLMDIYCDIAGPAAGTVILIIYLLWMVLLSALYIRYFAMRLVGAIYPNTDISVFIISMLAVIVYTLGFGVTTLARFNEVLLPFL